MYLHVFGIFNQGAFFVFHTRVRVHQECKQQGRFSSPRSLSPRMETEAPSRAPGADLGSTPRSRRRTPSPLLSATAPCSSDGDGEWGLCSAPFLLHSCPSSERLQGAQSEAQQQVYSAPAVSLTLRVALRGRESHKYPSLTQQTFTPGPPTLPLLLPPSRCYTGLGSESQQGALLWNT